MIQEVRTIVEEGKPTPCAALRWSGRSHTPTETLAFMKAVMRGAARPRCQGAQLEVC